MDPAEIDAVFRREWGRSVATLIRLLGQVDAAEDAVQDAFLTALRVWPDRGVPPNPGGWITTTARNSAIDRLRRDARGRELQREVTPYEPMVLDNHLEDDRLRLIFTCCHPALSREAQVALTLRLIGGLPTTEVARAFLTTEATMTQRLVRAKRKIKLARIPYRVPETHELGQRLPPVLAVVYLIYNAGSPDLRQEAVRLARLVVALLPAEAEVAGLLALLLLTESRYKARVRDGELVLLRDQDRSRWDRALITEGHSIVRECLQRNDPGPYQLQAAINAVHTDAASIEATDWRQVVALYDQLLALSPTAVVALNRAIAVAEVEGPAAGLALVDALDLDGYHPYHAARADLLQRLGRAPSAEYARAAAAAPEGPERDYLARQARRSAAES